MDNMIYLILAYSAVWVVLATYIFILLGRNRRMARQVEDLIARLDELENKGTSDAAS